MITRAVIEPIEESTVFTASPVKSFKSAFNTVVTHLTFLASKESVSVFDGDGNQLASFGVQGDQLPSQILKSNLANDPTFFVLY